MIRVEGVTKYHMGEIVLDNINLDISKGKNIGLIGPGGAGKSLLSKIIVGLVKPDSGRIYIDDEDVTDLAEIDWAIKRFDIGMLFQNYALFDFMTVGENIAFPLFQEGNSSNEEIKQSVETLLKQVDLPGIEHLQINELSGGMKKRVSFARAVIRHPPILIYDDPTAGLDPVTSSKIFELLKQIKEDKGTTSITISHDLIGLRGVCDTWAMLDKGKVLVHGSRNDVETCEHPVVKEFWTGTKTYI
jgi:phospholipid/cholesterol/gamma-HCH transport system ATP-binding protein